MQQCYNHVSNIGSEEVVYVGDGLWDMKASSQLKWGFVGIGNRLKNTANIWVSDFEDPNWIDAPDEALQRARASRANEL